MNMMGNSNIKQMITTLCLVLLNFVFMVFPVNAESDFDPDYYASIYPDVVNVLGTDPQVLYNHFLEYGMKEGRIPYREAQPGSAVEGIVGVMASQKEIADDVETKFDPVYYANMYPSDFIVLGSDPQVLYDYYLKAGIKEGKIPYEGAEPGAPVTGILEITSDFTQRRFVKDFLIIFTKNLHFVIKNRAENLFSRFSARFF